MSSKSNTDHKEEYKVYYPAFDMTNEQIVNLITPALVIKTLKFIKFIGSVDNIYSYKYRSIIDYINSPTLNDSDFTETSLLFYPHQVDNCNYNIYYKRHNITSVDLSIGNYLKEFFIDFKNPHNVFSNTWRAFMGVYQKIFDSIYINKSKYSIFDISLNPQPNEWFSDETKRFVAIFGPKIDKKYITQIGKFVPFAILVFHRFFYVIVKNNDGKYETHGITKRSFELKDVADLNYIFGIIYLNEPGEISEIHADNRLVEVTDKDNNVKTFTIHQLFSMPGIILFDNTNIYDFVQHSTVNEMLDKYFYLPLEPKIAKPSIQFENYQPFLVYEQTSSTLPIKFTRNLITCVPKDNLNSSNIVNEISERTPLCIVRNHHIINCFTSAGPLQPDLGTFVSYKVIEIGSSSQEETKKIFWVQFRYKNEFIHCPFLILANLQNFEKDIDKNTLRDGFPQVFKDNMDRVERVFGFKAKYLDDQNEVVKIQLLTENPLKSERLRDLPDFILIYCLDCEKNR